MNARKRVLTRVQRTMLYWGLLKHPFGQAYVRDRYSPTGKVSDAPAEPPAEIPVVGPTDPDA